MKVLTVVRLHWLALAGLVIGWSVNFYEALSRPTVDRHNAQGFFLLALIGATLIQLTKARRMLAVDPSAVMPIEATRYVIAALALAALVGAVLLGIHASR